VLAAPVGQVLIVFCKPACRASRARPSRHSVRPRKAAILREDQIFGGRGHLSTSPLRGAARRANHST